MIRFDEADCSRSLASIIEGGSQNIDRCEVRLLLRTCKRSKQIAASAVSCPSEARTK